MSQGSFSAQVSAFVAKTKERQTAVYRTAAQAVFSIAQTPVGAGGNMPVDTGFLRASLVVNLGFDVPMKRDKPDGPAAFPPADFALTINQADIDTPITGAWSASYARHVEYGARGRPGRRFVALAAQQWGRIVEQACLDAKAAVGE